MEAIPLINAEVVGRIAGLLDAHGIPANRYLERSRISPALRQDPRGFVHGRSVWTLVGSTDDGEALGDFWLEMAQLTSWRRAAWVEPLRHATTLQDALTAMSLSYPRQIPMNALGTTLDGDIAWFWRRRVCNVDDWPGADPAEQYTLSFMLEVVREAAGPGWLPDRLRVESPPSGWPSATKLFPGVRIEFNQPLLAIAIPVSLLALPVAIRTETPTGGYPTAETSFRGSLRQVIEPLLQGGVPSQDIAAEMLWTTPRTLRRRLAAEHSSWRATVNDLKFGRAVDRLLDGRHTVREIAEELGYSDLAHFSRFFRGRAGVPPSRYRERVESARALIAHG